MQGVIQALSLKDSLNVIGRKTTLCGVFERPGRFNFHLETSLHMSHLPGECHAQPRQFPRLFRARERVCLRQNVIGFASW